jgi:2-oxoglutarate dehydrogenase E1 component
MSKSSPNAAHKALDLSSENLVFLEGMLADYAADPQAAPADWQRFFSTLSNGQAPPTAAIGKAKSQSESTTSQTDAGSARFTQKSKRELELVARQERVDELIRNFRVRGHIVADIDPLDRPRPKLPELDPSFYGFTPADYDRSFSTRRSHGADQRTLREILAWVYNTYCRSIGVQFMHIDDLTVRQWLQDRMESTENHCRLERKEQLRILKRLIDAVIFEEFLQTKFTGAKSFSLEGAETLIPLLDLAIERAGDHGVNEIILGMAHRGRLNVLANIIGKRPREIFSEFLDVDARADPGDVKYHLGYSSDWITGAGRKVHLSLCFNPSHLEFVNAVALGRMRAKQDRAGDRERRNGLVILIHGDAAFAGEGVVQESLNLSELAGYRIGGALHVVVNNQIGFTTTPAEARSSVYATDVAKLLQSPIFHVNGEDPEAAAQAVRLALDFRREFHRDAVIDMYCYRRRGHNEGDEPSFTQPVMYEAIGRQSSVRDGYLKRMLATGRITQDDADSLATVRQVQLEMELAAARSKDYRLSNPSPVGPWASFHGGPASEAGRVDTGIDRDKLGALLEQLAHTPDEFHLHPKLKRFLQRRRRMAAGDTPLDWAAAEALALATLAVEGYRIRLSGQDSERGTFSQRHAVLHDVENGSKYTPLAHLAAEQAPVEIVNSPLSEAGVLGFDYGYSLDWPDGLVMWEAQFGDFVNAGQVVVDQFIASAETKWRRLSGVVLLLPHGYEGQGPEHSSARLERFLALGAQDNIQVVCPSTPAQYFHCLRRQVLRPWRKPLVVMTPKSMLRRPECTSSLAELARGAFRPVKPEAFDADADQPQRVLMCSGKIYYDLSEARATRGGSGPPIIRVEQLYPLPLPEWRAALAPYAVNVPLVWVQEEPENMGPWRFVLAHWNEIACGRRSLSCVSRPASASPATGSKTAHDREHQVLIDQALNSA